MSRRERNNAKLDAKQDAKRQRAFSARGVMRASSLLRECERRVVARATDTRYDQKVGTYEPRPSIKLPDAHGPGVADRYEQAERALYPA